MAKRNPSIQPERIDEQKTYMIQQESNNRFLDAYEDSEHDYGVVTRPSQNNNTQRWRLRRVEGEENVFTIQQEVNHQYLDAHEIDKHDFRAVTRTLQLNDTQKWIIAPAQEYPDLLTIQQKSSGWYLDAHQDAPHDFAVVTRERQYNSTQRWAIRYQTNYQVTLYTADIRGAGTDASVFIKFVGDTTSDEFLLVPKRNLIEELKEDKKNYLERDTEEPFFISTLDDYGDLRQIVISLGDGRWNDDWDLDKVTVCNEDTGQEWMFPANVTIEPEKSKTLTCA